MKKRMLIWSLCILSFLLIGFASAEESPWLLAAENEKLALYFNGDYTALQLEEKESGKHWYSSMQEDQVLPGVRVNRTWQRRSQSLALLHYTDAKAATGDVVTNDLIDLGARAQVSYRENGVDVQYTIEKLSLAFTLSFTLQDASMTVNIPFDSLQENGIYAWTDISLLPFFGTTNDWDDGYILYPSGCGELYRFKDKRYRANALNTISIPVYAQHITQEAGFPFGAEANLSAAASQSVQAALLPAFGVKQGNHAFAAVVEKGDAECDIILSPGGSSLPANSIYTKFSYRTNYGVRGQNINIGGRSEISYVSVLNDRAIRPGDRQIRYTFLQDEQADYAGMAQAVRQSYVDRGLLTPLEKAPQIVLDVFCAIEQQLVLTKEYMVGTTFAQAESMIRYFQNAGYSDMHVNLKGWGSHGLMSYPDYLGASNALGGKRGLSSLASLCKENGIPLNLQVNLLKLRDDNKGFLKINDGARDANDNVFTIETKKHTYYLQNTSFRNQLFKELKDYTKDLSVGFTYEDIGAYLYDDFGNGVLRGDLVAWWQEKLTDGDAVIGGNACMLGKTALVREIPEESVMMSIGDASVPFYQMVMHGNVAYTGQPVNLFYDDVGQLLKMLEYGYTPCFELSQESVRRLADTDYALLFSAKFDTWADEVEAYAPVFIQAAELTGNKQFTDHRQLAENVYLSEFEDVLVYVNYGEQPYEDIPGGGYKILRKGE